MKTFFYASTLIAVIILSAAWASWRLDGQRPLWPVVGSFHRSKVDGSGHSRGIVQVDLMRQIMADRARSKAPAIEPRRDAARRVPTLDHPLVGRRAPALGLEDTRGETWSLEAEASRGPVVVVFYLGSSCVACVTHLVELDMAMARFRERGARLLAISGDAPEFSRQRIRKFGGFQIPLLSDPDHSASMAFGVWKPASGGLRDDGEALHGTFIVARGGHVRWAYVGDRPFRNIEALLIELDSWKVPPSNIPTPTASE